MQYAIKHRSALRVIGLVLAALLMGFSCCLPTAEALTTVKCTARPNAKSGNAVLGGTITRITWEGQADESEQVAGLELTMPDGTSFGIDDARVTMLSGPNLMDRTVIDAEITADGQVFTATFPEPVAAGAYLRVEIYDVIFPAEGGQLQLTGTYLLADGSSADIGEIPALTITGISKSEQLSQYLADQEWVQKWNENKFLRLFLNPIILVSSFPVVVKGFFMALGIVLVAFPLAIPFGLLFSMMRMSKFKILRALASIYVNIIRGTPVFLQIYIAFFGLPLAGINIPSFLLGVIVLAMNSCAYQCEIFRGGIQSIPKGQFEASRSLGMNGAQTMLSVIIPQTIRRVIPTMTSEFILLYKDTSLLAAVGVMEVVMYAKTIVAATGSITPYIVAAVFYLVITLPLARLVGKLEAKLAVNDTGGSVRKKRKRDQKPLKGAATSDVLNDFSDRVDPVPFAAEDGRTEVLPVTESSLERGGE